MGSPFSSLCGAGQSACVAAEVLSYGAAQMRLIGEPEMVGG